MRDALQPSTSSTTTSTDKPETCEVGETVIPEVAGASYIGLVQESCENCKSTVFVAHLAKAKKETKQNRKRSDNLHHNWKNMKRFAILELM